MIRDQDRYRRFSRRALLMGGGQLALCSVLVGRLYYLQVMESDRYRTLADDNRINLRLLAPQRGRILDRHGVLLAINSPTYRLIIVREGNPDVEATLNRIADLITLDPADLRRTLREVGRRRAFVPVVVRDNLDWDEVSRIELRAPELSGIHIEEGQNRHYPFGESAAHVVGYVGPVSPEEHTGERLFDLPSFRIGKTGIERAHDIRLRGGAGQSEVEVNALGRVIRELRRREGQPGDDVRLTLDIGLQEFAHARLGGESGAVVVMDARDGAVRALASTPSFDPNAFTTGIGQESWRALLRNERSPLTNKAISGQYPPGSTYKMAVALAALEAGIIRPDHRVFCSGHVELGNARFHCWKRGGHGDMDMVSAIQQSCDVYFYDLARRVGVDRISAMAERLGLGERYDLDVPGERTGVLPTRAWKQRTMGQPWHLGETLIAGIGQGYVLSTPLQLAVMTARLATGRQVRPYLTDSVNPAEGAVAASGLFEARAQAAEAFPDLGLSRASLDLMHRGMRAGSYTPLGTAFAARITNPESRMAGKTGTSQVRRISLAERERGVRENEDLPWRERNHALFVGYAPMEAPRLAISVIVEHGGSGGRVAAPIARDVMEEALRREASPGGDVAGGLSHSGRGGRS